MKKLLPLLLMPVAAAAAVIEFVEFNLAGDARKVALGYPVPAPVASQTPVDGFRDYLSLLARLRSLILAGGSMVEEPLGTTLANRAISGFVLSDADTLTAEGFTEPAMLINGGIHAREWASPEVVTAVAERLMEREGDAGFNRYLLENTKAVVIPVLNVDGFLQTQRYPALSLQTEFPGDPQNINYPRDGRMQRKNMRDKDENLCAADDTGCLVRDGMNGVDPNRNHAPLWATSNRSSSDPRSLVYHGNGPGSENESQALYAAARLAGETRLRFYTDVHSFSRIFFAANTGNARRDAIQQSLVNVMRAVTSNRYGYDPTPAGVGIGSTDEYFAYTYNIPAYTLEIEPGPNGAQDYGAPGYHHDGFILPEAQIARVRDELTEVLLLGVYRMAGPPSIRAVEISEAVSGAAVFRGTWNRVDESARRFDISLNSGLRNEVDYTVWVAFNKPMRVRDGAGNIAQYGGQNIQLAPSLTLEVVDAGGTERSVSAVSSTSGWRSTPGAAPNGVLLYAEDAYQTQLRIPAAISLAGARRIALAVDAQDLSGQKLDASPATALDFFNGGWARYEDSAGTQNDTGGVDRSARVVDDSSPVFISAPPAPAGDGGRGGAISFTLLLALTALRGLQCRPELVKKL